jgi:hypothetical protein
VYAFHDYRQGQQRLRSGHHVQSEAFGRDGNIQRRIDQGRILLAGEGLDPTSNGTRVTFSGNKRTVVDGPFTETKELIAGFWLWNVKSKEEAIEWVKRCPNPHNKDSEIEIRQVVETEDFGAGFTPELGEQEQLVRAQAGNRR